MTKDEQVRDIGERAVQRWAELLRRLASLY